MVKTLQDYRNFNFPKKLSSGIECWFDVIHDYTDRAGVHDAIYWYNERANVGAFASALSRLNLSVIEEYGCAKGEGEGSAGRADISFYLQGNWYVAEAKIQWKWLSHTSRNINIAAAQKAALQDTYRTQQGYRDPDHFALTFIVPYIHPQDKKYINQYVTETIEHVKSFTATDCDFWAYCAPGKLRELQSGREHKNFYPMVIMVGKKLGDALDN